MEFLQGTGNALTRSLLIAAQRLAHRREVALLEKAEQDGGAVFGPQLVDGFVQDRRNLCQVLFSVVLERIHFDCLPFTSLTTTLTTQGRRCHKNRVVMKPSAEHHVAGEIPSFSGQ